MDRRKFLNLVGCGCCGYFLTSCGTVPITDRKQLKLIPEAKLNAQAAQLYEKVKEKEKLSDDIKSLNLIKEIGKKMEDSISQYFENKDIPDPTSNFQWEYILIDNKKMKNAWCMPGGKIAVYTGMLEITKNEDGLAAVMGHEVAHAVAKHSVERASRGVVLQTGTQLLDIFSGGKLSQVNRTTGMDTVGLLSKIGIMNPFTRKQESEADYLGLIFSSLSGYDIRETIKIWERMKEANKGKEPPVFMNTHPSSKQRIENINGWIDWNMSSENLIRFINAFDEPYEGAKTFLYETEVKILDTRLSGSVRYNHSFVNGIVTNIYKDFVIVQVSKGQSLIIKMIKNKKGENFSYLADDTSSTDINLVFFHATGFNSNTYRILLEKMKVKFEKKINIYALDQRGHGLSEAEADFKKLKWLRILSQHIEHSKMVWNTMFL